MTRVVNLYKEPYDVYIGRSGKGKDGYFGNPFIITNDAPDTREIILNKYRNYFYQRLEQDDKFKQKILDLKDKTLGCFCKPKRCHGDIIAEWLNNL